ncbi:DUF695 domain-containing protein [Paenibacillus beijingensis]|uniref:Uncharacterized protein n=1 Tax=Paenibacillus beijingensis TaxID=1126833 RepID=A0A0D5NKM9_9BACL|nr:DUF695 domain-containing protein [Paenibacillus beijingensis]AJY75806.1 hypothetical protein VN24_16170 [Paenibacillus beijingensis]
MTDDWGFFERRTDTEHMRILVNSAWKQEGAPKFGDLLSVTINLYPIKDYKSSKQTVIRQLEQIENELEQIITAGAKAVYVGRINTPRRLEYYYYISSDHTLEGLDALLNKHRLYRMQQYRKEDSDWSFYRYLLPSALEELFIHNAQMVYALLHRGDDIKQPRNVYHWLLFKGSEERKRMRGRLEGMGYRIEDGKSGEPEPGFPYPLVISRFEDVRLETVNGRVDELYQLLNGNGGKYDGWGSVMKMKFQYRFKSSLKRWFDTIAATFKTKDSC